MLSPTITRTRIWYGTVGSATTESRSANRDHSQRPASVDFEDRKYREVAALEALADGTWYYDAKLKNVHVRVKVKAGEDRIVNLNFE